MTDSLAFLRRLDRAVDRAETELRCRKCDGPMRAERSDLNIFRVSFICRQEDHGWAVLVTDLRGFLAEYEDA